MAEYIEREKAIKARHGCEKKCAKCDFAIEDDSWCQGEVFVVDLLRAPSADVAPVRHGRWIFKADSSWRGGGKYECSACKYGYAIGAYHEPDEFTYCPHCGAYMKDGGET